MKQRVLFVDDEPLVLQGLQRMLRSMRDEWEMEFADGGARALALFALKPFDVIVADMRMPGMTGAELLNEVMKLHPRTVRIILSGHADKDLIMKCVGSTHQYLAKPCDPEMLRRTVRRASSLEATLRNEALRKLTAKMDRLPSLPALYVQIVERLQSPDVGLDGIAEIVARDIGMTAKILKLVNSAFFGLRREMSDAREAVCYLGVDTIKSLVLSLHAFSEFESARVPGFSPEALWHHSMRVAVAARAIARFEQAESKLTEDAFGAGLLHDAGKLVLACNFGPRYTEALELARAKTQPLLAAEQEIFGATHAEVGGYLLGLWGLPLPVVEAIALHHSPGPGENRGLSPLAAVHAAEVFIHSLDDEPGGLPHTKLDLTFLTESGLGGQHAAWEQAVKDGMTEGENL